MAAPVFGRLPPSRRANEAAAKSRALAASREAPSRQCPAASPVQTMKRRPAPARRGGDRRHGSRASPVSAGTDPRLQRRSARCGRPRNVSTTISPGQKVPNRTSIALAPGLSNVARPRATGFRSTTQLRGAKFEKVPSNMAPPVERYLAAKSSRSSPAATSARPPSGTYLVLACTTIAGDGSVRSSLNPRCARNMSSACSRKFQFHRYSLHPGKLSNAPRTARRCAATLFHASKRVSNDGAIASKARAAGRKEGILLSRHLFFSLLSSSTRLMAAPTIGLRHEGPPQCRSVTLAK